MTGHESLRNISHLIPERSPACLTDESLGHGHVACKCTCELFPGSCATGV